MPLAGSSRFELLSKLGEGGMGIVYEAHDRERNMRVALKTLRRLDASSLYQFKREFRALSDLSHPNIVALYELVSEDDDWFLSMELVAGTDFLAHVHRRTAAAAEPAPPAPGSSDETPSTRDTHVIDAGADTGAAPAARPSPLARVDVDEVVDLDRLRDALVQLAQALHALHAHGMVHRDLKPSNVRVTPEGRVVLMDFGIVALTREPSEKTARPRTVGTPAYMAPEQAAGKPPTAAADWYGFGALLYQALTRRLPHEGSNDQMMLAKQQRDPVPPSAYVRGIPEDLDRLCMRLLARSPAGRPTGAEVLACLGADTGPLASLAAGPGAQVFVGRAEHLAALHAAYASVLAGQSACVVVEGPSGMGKSTLLRRFARALCEDEAETASGAGDRDDAGNRQTPMLLTGRCHERESVPFKAFDGIIDALSHELLALPDPGVESLLPADVDLLSRLFPVLRRIPGVQVARPLSGANLPELRARAVEALRLLLDNLGARQPVVMRIDDLQWADRSSLDLLVDLLRPPAPRRLMVLVSIRTDTPAFEELRPDSQLLQTLNVLRRREQCVRLDVGPLAPEEQALLVAALVGQQRPSRGTSAGAAGSDGSALAGTAWADVQAESRGNPLFLIQLARFVAELPEHEQRTRRVRLEDVIVQRFEQLPAYARALLTAVAVAGEPLPLQILATAAGLSSTERERAASMLRVHDWIRSAHPDRGSWIDVQHQKLREILLGYLPPGRRLRMHLCLAQALEHWDDAPVTSLTRHWMAAGDRAQAALYLVSAARFAAQKLAFDRAASLYRVVLELRGEAPAAERRPLLEALADALAFAGRAYEAAEAYAAAAAAARDATAAARDAAGAGDTGNTGNGEDIRADLTLMRLSADHLLRSGHVERGLRVLDQVLDRLGTPVTGSRRRAAAGLLVERLRLALRSSRASPPPSPRETERLDALHAAAMVLAMTDDARGAVMQMRHLNAALRHGDEHQVCRALATETAYLGAFGRRHARRAQEMSRDITLRARKLGDPYLIGLAHLCASAIAFFADRMRTAAEQCTDSLAALETVLGAEWERTTAAYFRCLSRVRLGEWSSLAREVPRAIEAAARRSDIYAASLFKGKPNTWRLLAADRVADAHESLDTALAGWPAGVFYLPHYQVALSRALIYLYEGDGAAAAQVLDRATPGTRRLYIAHAPVLANELLACRGRAALLLGDVATVQRVARRLARRGTASATARAALLEAPLRLHRGDEHEAERLLSTAIDGFNEQGASHLEAACQYRLGQLLGGSAGRDLVDAAQGWLQAQSLANPERMLALLSWSEPEVGGAVASRRQPTRPPQRAGSSPAPPTSPAHPEPLARPAAPRPPRSPGPPPEPDRG